MTAALLSKCLIGRWLTNNHKDKIHDCYMWIFSFVNVPPQPKMQSQKKGSILDCKILTLVYINAIEMLRVCLDTFLKTFLM